MACFFFANKGCSPHVCTHIGSCYQGGFNFFLEPNATYKALLRDGEGWFITGGELQNAQTEYQKGCGVLQNQLVALQAKSDSLRKA